MEELKEAPKASRDINPELIKEIESLKISPDKKAELLLTISGIKPANLLTVKTQSNTEGEPSQTLITDDEISKIYQTMQDSGLPFKILPEIKESQKNKVSDQEVGVEEISIQAIISNDEDRLEKLEDALNRKDHETIGLLLGIPQSAVEAFARKRRRLDIKTLPKEIIRSDSFIFLFTYTFSEDNFQDELAEGKIRAEYVKNTSPKIYADVVSFSERMQSMCGFI